MKFSKIFVIFVLVLITSNLQIIWARLVDSDFSKYESNRQSILLAEQQMAFGGNLTLDEIEESANNCLMKAKFDEVDEGFLINCIQYYDLLNEIIFFDSFLQSIKVFTSKEFS